MSYQIKTCNGQAYIDASLFIARESDALELVAVCGEHRTHRLLLHAEQLSDEFFDLRSGLAGAVLQKFVNYAVRVAAVIPPERANQGRFGEMVLEANRGRHFRVFAREDEAARWLVS